jgi:hypothetical protein
LEWIRGRASQQKAVPLVRDGSWRDEFGASKSCPQQFSITDDLLHRNTPPFRAKRRPEQVQQRA